MGTNAQLADQWRFITTTGVWVWVGTTRTTTLSVSHLLCCFCRWAAVHRLAHPTPGRCMEPDPLRLRPIGLVAGKWRAWQWTSEPTPRMSLGERGTWQPGPVRMLSRSRCAAVPFLTACCRVAASVLSDVWRYSGSGACSSQPCDPRAICVGRHFRIIVRVCVLIALFLLRNGQQPRVLAVSAAKLHLVAVGLGHAAPRWLRGNYLSQRPPESESLAMPTPRSPLQVLGDTRGGQVVQLLLRKGNTTISRVVYGGLSVGGVQRFACASFQVLPLNATVDRLLCTVPPGVGVNLRFTLVVCASGLYGCYPVADSGTVLFRYPAPLLTPGTLRYTATPTLMTRALGASNSLPMSVSFDGANFFTAAPDLLSIRYGSPGGNPLQYSCTPDLARSSYTTVTCTTQSDSQGLGLVFTVTLAAATATGTDTLNYATEQPFITSIHGCGTEKGNATSGCPTRGQVPVVLRGHRFFEPLTVLVNGVECLLNRPTSATRVNCTLPAGAGSDQPVVLVSASFFSPLTKLLSYAKPAITALSSPASTCQQQAPGSPSTLVNCPRLGYTLPCCIVLRIGRCCRQLFACSLLCRNVTLTITGSSFGSAGALVFVGTSQCSPVWHDPDAPQSILRCRLPAGKGQGVPVQVFQKNGELSLDDASISYVQCPAGTSV